MNFKKFEKEKNIQKKENALDPDNSDSEQEDGDEQKKYDQKTNPPLPNNHNKRILKKQDSDNKDRKPGKEEYRVDDEDDDEKDFDSKKISVTIAALKGKSDDEVVDFVNNWIGKIIDFMTENGVQVDSKASEVRFNVNNKEYLHGKYSPRNAGVAKKDDKKKQPFIIEYKPSGEIIITVNDDKSFDALTKYLDSEKLKYKVFDQEKDGKNPEGVKDNKKPEEAKKGGFEDMLKKQRESAKDKQKTP